jgi:peptidoglycan-associated lipoprotein
VAVLAFAMGCASKNQPVEEQTDVEVDSEFSDGSGGMDDGTMMRETTDVEVDLEVTPVYFDFDSYEIRREFGPMLNATADALKETGASVMIAGHTDDRGSEEYNLALGERRAGAVRKYLYNLGVPMGQMSIVSYGEAQPAVSGTGERVWALNRRADLNLR